MAWPYDDEPMIGPMPAPEAAPEPSFEEFVAALGPNFGAQQEAIPQDFFARLAMAQGPQPFHFQPRQKPTALEVILAGAAGFGNARAAQGARRVAETKDRNTQAREAAKTLATWRHQERVAKQTAEQNRENIRLTANLRPEPKSPEQIEAEARARAAGGREGAPPIVRPMPVFDPNTGNIVLVDPSQATGKQAPQSRGRLPTAGERNLLTDEQNAIKQTDEVKRLYRREYVGPYTGGVRGGFSAKTGRGLKPGEAKFRAAVATYANKARNILFGSALTATEKEEAYKQLPDSRDPSESFEAKLEMTRDNLRRVHMLRRETYEATGLDLSRVPQLDGGEIELVRDANGKLVRKQ